MSDETRIRELEAERAKLQRSLAAALDGERYFARSHVELAKVLGVDPAQLEDGPACLHDAIASLRSERDDLRARLDKAIELVRALAEGERWARGAAADFLSEEQAREEGR
jgi:hypothetical protein